MTVKCIILASLYTHQNSIDHDKKQDKIYSISLPVCSGKECSPFIQTVSFSHFNQKACCKIFRNIVMADKYCFTKLHDVEIVRLSSKSM